MGPQNNTYLSTRAQHMTLIEELSPHENME